MIIKKYLKEGNKYNILMVSQMGMNIKNKIIEYLWKRK